MSSLRFLGAAALAAVLAVPAAALAQQAPPAPPPAGAPLPGGAPGQSGHRHGHHGGMRAALSKLNLSDAQKTQIQQAMTQTREANRNADPATRKANREKLHAQIEGILTPAQRTQLGQEMAQMRARHARQGGAWASPMPGATPAH